MNTELYLLKPKTVQGHWTNNMTKNTTKHKVKMGVTNKEFNKDY